MRLYISIVLLLLYSPVWAQNFEDGFSDGDFTSNPFWSGADSNFVVFDLGGNKLLRLNDNDAASSYLSTISTNVIGYWEFFIRIDGSTPSNGNKSEIYLMSDIADLSGPLNGYALRIGQSRDDFFKIVRLDAGIQTSILEDTTLFAAGGSYRVKVKRDSVGSWSLEVGEGYNGVLKDSGISVTDNTYSSSSFFGVSVTYTSTRVDDYYFDFKIDPPQVIIDPLYVDHFSRFSDREIDISFSRDINFESVASTDFLLNGIFNPESFSSQGSNGLRMTFTEAFTSGENELLVSGIESSVIDTVLSDTTLIFFLFDDFESGDILINEFLKDPPTGSGISEYIELKNTTSKYLNLKDWEIGDNNTLVKISVEDVVLLPDSLIVVTSNPETLFTNFGEGVYVDVSLPALNNTTDQIRLFDRNGILIDSLEYTIAWGGVDVALERRSEEVKSTFQANWGDSPNAIGTAGKENKVEVDSTAPYVIDAFLLSDSKIGIVFDALPIEPEVSDLNNYTLLPEIEISEVTTSGDTVIIQAVNPFIDGQRMEITIRNQQDIFGNVQSLQSIFVTYVQIQPAIHGEVVVNEILYRRKDELSPEFVELFNTSEKNFDLSGWSFRDASSSWVKIPHNTFLRAGGFLVLTDREDFAESLENAIYLSSFPSLNDSGDQIIIKNEDEITIDSLFYESSWGGNFVGVSVERKDPLRASNDATNWKTSTSQSGYTAGVQSSVFEEDLIPPEIIFATQVDSVVKIIFSEFVNTNKETVFNVNGIDVELLSLNKNKVIVEWNPEPALKNRNIEKNSDVIVSNITDIKGNIADEVSSPIAYPISKGSIVINEIMYDPLADSNDNLPDQTEYVELYNRNSSAISLEGITLHDAPDEDNEIRILEPISSQYKWIAPNGYFLIYSEDEVEVFSESKTARYFSMEEELDQFTMQIDRSNLSLSSSGDAIYLSDAIGATIDSVYFDESWQNPNVFDTDGIALERINPEGESNSEINWSSSTHVSGGTPNSQNTIFQKPGVLQESSGIIFSPNPFSPDGDGYDDNLFITYKLDAPDYLLRVRIFDRYGREVRKLVDGQQAGFEGALLWDGLTDDQQKNRVGIYIVLFEAYNSASGSDRIFKETVVLARMF